MAIIIFVSSSSQTIEWAAQKYAPEYGFTYDQISGTLLTGVEIKKLRHKDNQLLESFRFGWNPASLLYDRVTITHIEAEKLDIDAIKQTAASFTSQDIKKPKENIKESKPFVMPVSIGLNKLHISLNNFVQNNISLENISLDAEDIVYRSELEIEKFLLHIDSNVTNLEIAGGLDDREVKLTSISLLDIDSVALENIAKTTASSDSNANKDANITQEPIKEPVTQENNLFDNPLIPVKILLDTVAIEVNPRAYEGIALEKIALNTKDISVDLENVLNKKPNAIAVDNLSLKVDSNVSDLALHLSLVNEEIIIEKLSLTQIDALTLYQLFGSKEQNSTDENSSIPSDSNSTSKEDNTTNPLIPKKLLVKNLHTSLKETLYENISIDKVALDTKDISVNIGDILNKKPNAISIANLTLGVDSNVSDIALELSLIDEELIVEKIFVTQIDTIALTQTFAPKEHNNTEQNSTEKESRVLPSSDENVTTDTESTKIVNPLLPKRLIVRQLHTSIKEAHYELVDIKSAEVNITKVTVDIINQIAKSAKINIKADSNFATLNYDATIKDNILSSLGQIVPLRQLYDTYELPLKEKAIEPILLKLNATEKRADVELLLKGEKLLKAKDGEFNVDKLIFINRANYLIEEKKLSMTNEANISTPYAKNIIFQNLLTFVDKQLHYSGSLVPGKLEGIEANLTKPIKDLTINYDGNISSVEATIDSKSLQGKFLSPDFKKANFHLSTKKPIIVQELTPLPEKLKKSEVGIEIDLPLDLQKITPLHATAKIDGNLAHIDADLFYDNGIKVETKTTFPDKSLLRTFDPALNLNALSPLGANVIMNDKNLDVDILSQGLISNVNFNPKTKNLDGKLTVGGANFLFKGNVEEKISLENNITSLQNLMKKISTIYAFEVPKLDGDAKLSLELSKMKDISLKLRSKELRFKADRKTEHILNDTMISLGFADSNLTLDSYHTTFQKQKIFATKPSRISIKDNIIKISPFWLNDELKVTGIYNSKEKKGDIIAYAESFPISHEMIDMKSKIDIKTKMEGLKTTIDGKVTIMGGNVRYDMDKKSFASDSDILIVQNIKKREPNSFSDNLMLSIVVDTKNPLIYKTDIADVKVKADVVAQQVYGDTLKIYGTAEIMDGSYYIFQEKKFVLKKSLIALAGDPSKPILDISAVYNSVNYEITIQVTGDPQTPHLIFSSVPRLTREQILSVILFDNEDAGDSSSGDEMMKMMGGAMAKAALSSVGVKIDHLSLGTDGSMEIGKKISDKVTIIYVNDEVSSARLQYNVNKNIKASIMSDGISSGTDIVYRREF